MTRLSLLLALCTLLITVQATIPNNKQRWNFVERHNYYRANTNPPAQYMPSLWYDTGLETTSNNWATQCTFGHSGQPNVGENVYATTQRFPDPNTFDANRPVDAWDVEEPYYNYTSNTCNTISTCGHYTAMIWANTLNVGCAFQDCPFIQNWGFAGTVVVCQYSPYGNIVGQRPYVQADWTVSWSIYQSPIMKMISYKSNSVWGVTPAPSSQIYQIINNTWTLMPGNLLTIGASVDGRPWGNYINGDMYRWDSSVNNWIFQAAPAGANYALQVDSYSANQAVMVDNFNNGWFYYFGNWYDLNGYVTWISVGANNDIWVLSVQGTLWRWTRSINNWVQYPGQGLVNIHVTDLQNMVGVTSDGNMWRFQNGNWALLPPLLFGAKHVSMSNGNMFAVNNNGQVYRDF